MFSMDLQHTLLAIFHKSPPNLFDAFIKEAADFYALPAHTLLELRERDNKKVRGDIFEEFCALYLKHVCNYDSVWLLTDVPDSVLSQLGMKRQDMGIDILVGHNGDFYAVQCKYKKPDPHKKTCITWKALSTFYALCLRAGPFQKYIVMTNCDYVRHQGKKTNKDVSMCVGTFRKLSGGDWLKLCPQSANTIVTGPPIATNKVLSVEELRQKRLQYFENKSTFPVI